MPRKGHGQLSRLATYMKVHTSFVSQVLKGPKDLSEDQAAAAAEFFSLSSLETEYFLILVRESRAATPRLRSLLDKQKAALKKEHERVAPRVDAQESPLSEDQKARFYSQWYYSALRLISSFDTVPSIEELSNRLSLSPKKIHEAYEFLLSVHLCHQEGTRIVMGNQRTHIDADSPLVGRHHSNWRLKASELSLRLGSDDLMFTGPLTLSHKDASMARKLHLEHIERISDLVKNSGSEELFCFNLDWFLIR